MARRVERERIDLVVEPVAVGVGEERIGALQQFRSAREAVAVFIRIRARIGAIDLDEIAEAVAVAVGVERIGAGIGTGV